MSYVFSVVGMDPFILLVSGNITNMVFCAKFLSSFTWEVIILTSQVVIILCLTWVLSMVYKIAKQNGALKYSTISHISYAHTFQYSELWISPFKVAASQNVRSCCRDLTSLQTFLREFVTMNSLINHLNGTWYL